MIISVKDCNPFVRAAEFQHAVLEGEGLRIAYDYRLFLVLENSGTLVLENEMVQISKGTVICIPPETGYCFRGKMRVAVINFDMTRACDDRKKPICPRPVHQFDRACVFDRTLLAGLEKTCTIRDGAFLTGAVTDIVMAFESAGEYSDALTSGYLKAILVNILRHNDGGVSAESRLALKVSGYIKMYATEIEGNNDVAHHFGYHPVYIAAVFKEQTGKTLHSAIVEQRISVACRFLSQTNLSVDDIAANTGFSSRSHFCTVFKRHIGVTPNKWRVKENV